MSLLDNIILLGAVQGFILTGLLIFSRQQRLSNKLLGALIFLIALASLKLYGNKQEWFSHSMTASIIGSFVPMIIVMPLGPLIYFYIRSSLDPSFRLGKKQRLQFLPAIIDLVPQLTTLVFVIGVLTYTFRNKPAPWGLFIDTYNIYSDIPRWLCLAIYILLSFRFLKNYIRVTVAIDNRQKAILKWLRQFLMFFSGFLLVWFIYLVPYVIPAYSNALMNMVDWYPVFIPMAFLIYWLGMKGYIISLNLNNEKKSPPLSNENIIITLGILKDAMEQKQAFLNPHLTLSVLARETGLPSKNISSVLNQHLQKSFNEYINEYRVQAIMQKIRQENNRHTTIAGIAYECGFNSQPTFQRAFKAFTGMTPREFILKES